MDNEIEFYAGDTASFTAVLTDLDGKVFDLKGYTKAILTIKKKKGVSTIVLQITGEIQSPESEGTILFEFTPADTAKTPRKYVYDIRVTNEVDVYTTVDDNCEILQPVNEDSLITPPE